MYVRVTWPSSLMVPASCQGRISRLWYRQWDPESSVDLSAGNELEAQEIQVAEICRAKYLRRENYMGRQLQGLQRKRLEY